MNTEPTPAARGAELLPCPFCGGPGKMDSGGPHNPSDWCGCCDDCDFSLDFKATQQEAIAAWNRRALSPSPIPAEPSPDVLGEITDRAPNLDAAIAFIEGAQEQSTYSLSASHEQGIEMLLVGLRKLREAIDALTVQQADGGGRG